MTDAEIDDLLKKSQAGEDPDPQKINRIEKTILQSLTPVKPLAPRWVWISALAAVFVVVAAIAAVVGGTAGLIKLDAMRRVTIFTVLAAATIIVITSAVREMVPAGKRPVHPRTIAVLSIVAMLTIFALLFQDYQAVRTALGMSCMRMGLICAAVTAVLSWLILRKGFVLDRVAVGIAAGTLAGLTGLTVLEIHCPIFTAPHILVWHVAVLAISAAAGALVGIVARR